MVRNALTLGFNYPVSGDPTERVMCAQILARHYLIAEGLPEVISIPTKNATLPSALALVSDWHAPSLASCNCM